MKIFVCVDNRNGIMFNNRRVSRDSVLNQKVIDICGENPLYVSLYSSKLFEKYSNVIVSNDFINKVSKDDFAFVEDIIPSEEDIDEVYLFKFNRNYPADTHLEIDLENGNYKKIEESDFVGSSHDEITLEVYKKEV